MSATLTTEPVSPASAHRPLEFVVTRTDPAATRIAWIRPATASDVTTLGNNLEEGDILLSHNGWVGPVPGIVGQTIALDATCDQYVGIYTILNAFTVTGTEYAVIDAADLGTFTPARFGTARIWLNNYTVWCELRVYTDPTADPHIVYLPSRPTTAGLCKFNVAPSIASFFSKRIDPFILPWSGTLIQSAHGITALFYEVRLVEVWDVPGSIASVNPWEDGTEIHDDEEYRVAVNAIHPYNSTKITWESAGMSAFQVSNAPGKLLTYAPQLITLADTDSFRIHMLTNPAVDYLTPSYVVRVFTVNDDLSLTFLGTQAIDLGATPNAAISVAVGPADLSPYFTLPSRYRAWISSAGGTVLSDYVEVIVDTKCKEVRRPIGWLGKLGGVDLFTFTGREIGFSSSQRTNIAKRMGSGTGFDYMEHGLRSQPARSFQLSTGFPLPENVRRWLVDDLTESASVALKLSDTQATPILLTSNDHLAANSARVIKALTVTYRRGTDNASQEA